MGSNQVLSETLTNTGGTTVTVTQVSPSGTGFSRERVELAFEAGGGSESGLQRYLYADRNRQQQRESCDHQQRFKLSPST